MGKLLAFLLGLAALSYAAYYFIDQGVKSGAGGPEGKVEAPLERVRGQARQIEQDAQKRADDLNAQTQ